MIVSVQNLRKYYGKEEVLKGISFQVNRGEIFSVVGPNGSGKTTTLKIILGLVGDFSGNVMVESHNISYVAENEGIYGYLTVREYLAFFASLYSVSEDKIEEVLDWVKMTHAQHKRCKHLSKGMKQRILLARAFMNDPELLVLDEPFSGLDPEIRTEFQRFMRDYTAKRNASIILTTHILSDVEKLSDRIAFIRDGRITAAGELEAVTSKVGGDKELMLLIKDNITMAKNILENTAGMKKVTLRGNVITCVYRANIEESEILGKLIEQNIRFSLVSGTAEAAYEVLQNDVGAD